MITKISDDDEQAQWIICHMESIKNKRICVAEEFPIEFDSYMFMHAAEVGDVMMREKDAEIIHESIFSSEQLSKVVNILKKESSTQDVYCFYENWYLRVTEKTPHLFYKCTLDDMVTLTTMKENNFTPTYWWAADRSWFFSHYISGSYAFIGGKAKLVNSFRAVTPIFIQVLGTLPRKDSGHFFSAFLRNYHEFYKNSNEKEWFEG